MRLSAETPEVVIGTVTMLTTRGTQGPKMEWASAVMMPSPSSVSSFRMVVGECLKKRRPTVAPENRGSLGREDQCSRGSSWGS